VTGQFDINARLSEMAAERRRRRDEDLALRHLAAAARRGDLRIDGGRLVMTVPRELLEQAEDGAYGSFDIESVSTRAGTQVLTIDGPAGADPVEYHVAEHQR
jgi:hypothetical protein